MIWSGETKNDRLTRFGVFFDACIAYLVDVLEYPDNLRLYYVGSLVSVSDKSTELRGMYIFPVAVNQVIGNESL